MIDSQNENKFRLIKKKQKTKNRKMNTESFSNDKQRTSQLRRQSGKVTPTFCYQIANMKAMKIVVMIKISKLKYELQELVEAPHPFYLKTQKGQLHKEYEIIHFIINESRENQKFLNENRQPRSYREDQSSSQANDNQQQQGVNLCGEDSYTCSRMMQLLFQLRSNLFPLLDEFYRYLTGHQRIKKIKYESLINKIKFEIAKLDSHMNQHSDVYSFENSFLNIIIACELFMCCKLVFEEKFRKSKYSLFAKYEQISKKPEFEEIYGKTTMCLKEYVPPEFEIQEESPVEQANKKSDEVIPPQIIKMSQNLIAPSAPQNDRNQLLYGYFRSVFSTSQHKKNYFPYFWLMFDSLNCSLVEIVYENSASSPLHDLNTKLKMLQFQLEKYLKITSVDYGIVGVYQHQNDKHYIVRGVLCLGSKDFKDLKSDMQSSVQLREWKLGKIDVSNETQKRQVQNIWQNTLENNNYDGIITCGILYI